MCVISRVWLMADGLMVDGLMGCAAGKHCDSNWYEGSTIDGSRKGEHYRPQFTGLTAPAVLGFDEAIDRACFNTRGGHHHAEKCIHSNLNILSLHGDRVPYNICRNLEWQARAAPPRDIHALHLDVPKERGGGPLR